MMGITDHSIYLKFFGIVIKLFCIENPSITSKTGMLKVRLAVQIQSVSKFPPSRSVCHKIKMSTCYPPAWLTHTEEYTRTKSNCIFHQKMAVDL